MAEVELHFKDFLTNIRLTQNQIKDLATGHKTLRNRLKGDEVLKDIVQTTFLQGSYIRKTAVKPKDGKRSDVDIIVVTNIDSDKMSPEEAMNMFVPFLDKYYSGKYEFNSRSIGIKMSYVDLDIVITAEVKNESNLNYIKEMDNRSIAELQNFLELESTIETYSPKNRKNIDELNNKKVDSPESLLIPDRDKATWEKTNPLAQINWTLEKNSNTNTHYINVVKATKWWKKMYESPKYPKGYPLEHFVGTVCPDGVTSVAEGVLKVFENIVRNYPTKPILPDHGVPEHDVFSRLTEGEYQEFYNLIKGASELARRAYDEEDVSESVALWRELFGNEFPKPPSTPKENNKFTKRKSPTKEIGSARFG